jgi:hypothetical protein
VLQPVLLLLQLQRMSLLPTLHCVGDAKIGVETFMTSIWMCISPQRRCCDGETAAESTGDLLLG